MMKNETDAGQRHCDTIAMPTDLGIFKNPAMGCHGADTEKVTCRLEYQDSSSKKQTKSLGDAKLCNSFTPHWAVHVTRPSDASENELCMFIVTFHKKGGPNNELVSFFRWK